MTSLDAAVKRTQEQFKDLIKKPPLTEKLLSRPPFRYMHDVIMELVRRHRFLKGLYSGPELDAENLKDKEAKVAFLQKSIDALSIVQGAALSCKATRMVSGQEPEKTNEFLQLMAATVVSKQDTTDAVRQVLGKTGKSKEPEAKEPPKEPPKAKEPPKEPPKAKESSDSKPGREKKQRSSREPTTAAAAAEDTEVAATGGAEAGSGAPAPAPAGDEASSGQARESRRTRKPKETQEESKEGRPKAGERERRRESRPKEEPEARGKEAKPRESSEPRAKEPGRGRQGAEEGDRERRKERKDRERVKPDDKSKRREGGSSEKPAKPEEQPEDAPQAAEHPPEKAERPLSPKAPRRGRRTSDKDVEEPSPALQRKAAAAAQEADFARPPLPPGLQAGGGKQRGPARPSSARPAPPKVRSRQDSAGSEDAGLSRVSSNVTVQPAVVMADDDDDDNDDMLVVDTSIAPVTSEQLAAPTLDKDADPAEHGMLVRKILDTKKEQEQVSGQNSSQESAITNAERRKMKEKTEKEVTKLRESVQTLCRSANPLAKTVDFIQEDVESMVRELDRWQEEAQQNSADLIKERELTETELEPLHQSLAELEATTVEKLDLIGVLKANIAKNDQQINQLVSGIALSSRQ